MKTCNLLDFCSSRRLFFSRFSFKGGVGEVKTYNSGEHATSLSDSTNGKSNSDAGEHALVHSKQKIRDLGRTDGGRTEDIAETNVLQITDVAASGVREGERVTPEEPLEGDHSRGHDREPYQRQGGLSAGETRIEETAIYRKDQPLSYQRHVLVSLFAGLSYLYLPDTWNHEKDERGGCNHPCDITRLERGHVCQLSIPCFRSLRGDWRCWCELLSWPAGCGDFSPHSRY